MVMGDRWIGKYFASHPLPVSRGAKILDAGCGTGLLTFAMMRSIRFPVSIMSRSICSATSIEAARKASRHSRGRRRDVTFTQGICSALPFADESLDLVATSGALEYVPLGDGLKELARVIAAWWPFAASSNSPSR